MTAGVVPCRLDRSRNDRPGGLSVAEVCCRRMPFESSTPFVLGCLVGAGLSGWLWRRSGNGSLLAAALAAIVLAVGIGVADRLVETDRELLLALFPRLAEAAARQDVDTILKSVDSTIRPLREEAEQAIRQVRPTAVAITRLDVEVESSTQPPTAMAVLIVRLTGDVVERGSSGTILVGLRVQLHKPGDRWLIRDAQAEEVRTTLGRP